MREETKQTKKNVVSRSELDYYNAGFATRGLTNWMLSHSSLSSWKQFYHKPYQTDYEEATIKARERYTLETGYKFKSESRKTLNEEEKQNAVSSNTQRTE